MTVKWIDYLTLINSKLPILNNMNYNEIRRLYDNVNNDELVSQTAYEFEIYDDYYYQLFHHYSVTNSEDNHG